MRTVRRDVDRLRNLGYPVEASVGVGGGYRLAAGSNVPPLLLDDDEALAVAIGLRIGTDRAVAGLEEASAQALVKLTTVLPARLRHRLEVIEASTVAVPADAPGPSVDPTTLATVAAACRDHDRMRMDYLAHDGTSTSRLVEPHRLVTWGRRWYLVAWDLDRTGWRTFRIDRMEPRTTGPRFEARPLPADGDVAAFVSRGVSSAAWRHRAEVTVHASARQVAERINPAVGVVEAIDDHRCRLLTGADSLEVLATHLGLLGVDFEVSEPPELVQHLRILADRYARSTATS